MMNSPSPSDLFDLLLAALKHPNPNLRAGAAIALGKTGGAKAVEPLVDALEDPVFLVYTSAARALGALGHLAVGLLIAVIQEPPSLDSASRAYEALRAIRDPQAIGLLIAATGYEETFIRWGALEALGHMRAETALPALLDAARHPEETTRQHAVTALGRIGHPDGVHAMTALLNEANWQMRVTAVQALGRIGTEAAILPILATLHDSTVQVREAAAQVLQTLRDPQAAEILLPAMNGADAWTRRTLARALGEIGNRQALPLLENMALDDDDVKVRLSAAQALAKLTHPRGEAVILRTLNAPSAQTRTLAAIALAHAGDGRAVSLLLESEVLIGKQTATAEARQLRQEIVQALGVVGGKAVPRLLEALESPYPAVRETAFHALREVGASAVPDLLTAFETAQPAIRLQVIRLLRAIADVRAMPFLIEILRDGVSSAFSPRLLVHAFYDPEVEARKLAADALGRIGTVECVGPLLASARFDLDREVRDRAAQALAGIGDAESILTLAEPQVFGEANRALIGVLGLLLMGFVAGGMVQMTGDGRPGLLVGLAAGASFGVADGVSGQRRAVRGALAGVVLVIFWGVFAWLFDGSPPLPELVQSPLVRVGALLLMGVGTLAGLGFGRSFQRENQRIILPRGCLFFIFPAVLAFLGLMLGGVLGAVFLLRAADPAFFRWVGGIGLGVLFVAVWLQRGKRLELQQGLLLGLALFGMVFVGTALALSVPDAWVGGGVALVLGCGALSGWQALPLIRRLAGLFGGMIAGFVGAGVGVWVVGMVF